MVLTWVFAALLSVPLPCFERISLPELFKFRRLCSPAAVHADTGERAVNTTRTSKDAGTVSYKHHVLREIFHAYFMLAIHRRIFFQRISL